MTTLDLGAATYSFLWSHPLAEALAQLADWGFKRIELMSAPPHLWPREWSSVDSGDLKKLLRANGMDLVALNPTFLDMNIASPNPGFRRESISQVMETIHLAHDLETALIVLIPGKRHPLVPQPFEETWKVARGAIEECLVEAERWGVTLGLENAPSLFMDRSEHLKRMAEEVDSDYLRIAFDVANGSESPPTALEAVKDYLVHVHVSDRDDGGWAHLPVGRGKIDFRAVYAKLLDIDFGGTTVIETTYLAAPDGGTETSKRALEAIGWFV